MATERTSVETVIIPGKAFELASASKDLSTELRLKLKMAPKHKKGRGYRVFVDLSPEEIETLGKYFASLTLSKLTLIEAQAVRNVTSRLFSGEKPVRPKTDKQGQMRDATAKAIWSVIAPLIRQRGCRCELRPGMTLEELNELGGGCTDPHDFKYLILKLPKPKHLTSRDRLVSLSQGSGFVCPTLDAYRRAVQKLNQGAKDDDN